MIVLGIYLLGYIFGYVLFKYNHRRDYGEWTKGSRKIALFSSIFSWFTVIIQIIEFALSSTGEDNKPAKW